MDTHPSSSSLSMIGRWLVQPSQNPRLLAVLVLFAPLVHAAAGEAEPYFTGLGDLPGGTFNSVARAVSADGSVVVGTSNVGGLVPTRGFQWTEQTGMVALENETGHLIEAWGVSQDGSIIVGPYGPASYWVSGVGLVQLGFHGIPYAVTTTGPELVITGSLSPSLQAFRWAPSTGMIPAPNPAFGGYVSISDDGLVIVGSGPGSSWWRWIDNGVTPLGQGFAPDVTPNGHVIVGYNNAEAFRWEEGCGTTGLQSPRDWQSTLVSAVSGDGWIIVGTRTPSVPDPQGAFIWEPTHGWQLVEDVLANRGIDLSGWSLISAFDISDNGKSIVGAGINPNGDGEAWIARLPDLSPCLAGDVDGDGVVTLDDVGPFVSALLASNVCTLSFFERCTTDVNSDSALDGKDAQSFVDLLTR